MRNQISVLLQSHVNSEDQKKSENRHFSHSTINPFYAAGFFPFSLKMLENQGYFQM